MVRADIDLNASGFLATLRRLDNGVMSFVGKFSSLIGGFAAIAAVVGAIGNLKGSLDLAGDLSDTSAATGETISDLMVVQQAFKNAGLGADGAGDKIAKLQRSMAGANEEGGATGAAFAKLGLSSQELAKMPVLEQIKALQGGFAGLTDKTERTKVATDLMGRSGAKWLAVIGDSSAIDVARQQLGGLPGLMEKNAAVFDSLSDAIGTIDIKFTQLSVGVLSVLAPQFGTITEAINSIDLTGIGQAIGNVAAGCIFAGKVLVGLGPILIGLAARFAILQVAGMIAAGGIAGAWTALGGVLATVGGIMSAILSPITLIVAAIVAAVAAVAVLKGGGDLERVSDAEARQRQLGGADSGPMKTILDGAPVGAMQRAGHGTTNGVLGASGADPMLSKADRTNSLLQGILGHLTTGHLKTGNLPRNPPVPV